jgi:hypothetical protein
LIRYFRINDPYRLAGLFVLLLILYLPLFLSDAPLTIPELKGLVLGEKQNEGYQMYVGVIDNTAPLAAWTHELLDTLFGRSLLIRHILAFMIIFFQSAYLGFLFISKKVFGENTYIPSFLFSLLFFFSFDTLALTNELLGSGFLLLALNYLFEEIEFRTERDESIFNLGVAISMASLFQFSFSVYLVGAAVILVIFTRSNLRKFLLLLTGYLLPHLFTLSLAFVKGSADEVWRYYYLSNLSPVGHSLVSTRTLLALTAIPLAYFVISIVMLNRDARFSKYQSQIMQVVLLWLGLSLLFVLIAPALRPQTLIVFIPGLSFLLTHLFLLIRRNKFIVLNSWILFAGIVIVAYLARFGKIESIDYRGLLVKEQKSNVAGKRVVVFDDIPELYLQNVLATPYLNWDLSAAIIRHPEYYENVIHVYHSFKNDPPDVVFDREDVFKGFLDRMPDIKANYIRQGDRYLRKISN